MSEASPKTFYTDKKTQTVKTEKNSSLPFNCKPNAPNANSIVVCNVTSHGPVLPSLLAGVAGAFGAFGAGCLSLTSRHFPSIQRPQSAYFWGPL